MECNTRLFYRFADIPSPVVLVVEPLTAISEGIDLTVSKGNSVFLY
jgi:hypothetical protein